MPEECRSHSPAPRINFQKRDGLRAHVYPLKHTRVSLDLCGNVIKQRLCDYIFQQMNLKEMYLRAAVLSGYWVLHCRTRVAGSRVCCNLSVQFSLVGNVSGFLIILLEKKLLLIRNCTKLVGFCVQTEKFPLRFENLSIFFFYSVTSVNLNAYSRFGLRLQA